MDVLMGKQWEHAIYSLIVEVRAIHQRFQAFEQMYDIFNEKLYNKQLKYLLQCGRKSFTRCSKCLVYSFIRNFYVFISSRTFSSVLLRENKCTGTHIKSQIQISGKDVSKLFTFCQIKSLIYVVKIGHGKYAQFINSWLLRENEKEYVVLVFLFSIFNQNAEN